MLNTLCIIFITLNALDLLTTLALIKVCHFNVEGNPIACFFYDTTGPLGMAGFKIVMTSIVLLIVRCLHFYGRVGAALFVMSLGCLITLYVVLFNIALIRFYFSLL